MSGAGVVGAVKGTGPMARKDTPPTARKGLPPTAREGADHPAPRRRRRKTLDLRVALAFIAPALVGFVVFYLWPALRGIYYAFTDYNLLKPPQWVGQKNYDRLIHDKLFWNSLKVTAEYVVINIGVQTVVAVGLAVLMHRLTKSTAIRGAILLPYLVANVVVALVWYWMCDYQIGIVNIALEKIGLDPVAFFGSSTWSIPTIALVNVWRHMGYTALLVFAGLQTIPQTIYEAATIDGSSEFHTFRTITLPLLRPVMAMVLVITVTGSFQIYDTVAVTTRGGPANATRVIYFYIFDQVGKFNFGYASAMASVLFLILAVVAFMQIKLMRAGESDLAG